MCGVIGIMPRPIYRAVSAFAMWVFQANLARRIFRSRSSYRVHVWLHVSGLGSTGRSRLRRHRDIGCLLRRMQDLFLAVRLVIEHDVAASAPHMGADGC